MGRSTKKAAKNESRKANSKYAAVMKKGMEESSNLSLDSLCLESQTSVESQASLENQAESIMIDMKKILASMEKAPCGQARPNGFAERVFAAFLQKQAIIDNIDTDDMPAYAAIMFNISKAEKDEENEKELADAAKYLVGGKTDAQKLSRMLSGFDDANNSVVKLMEVEHETFPPVSVRTSGKKGDGVFANRDLKQGERFTTYPCLGLVIPRDPEGGGKNSLLIASTLIFPVDIGELNLYYAINVPIFNMMGVAVQIVGHKDQRHSMACGHMINDSHTVEELGGETEYNAFASGNCTPKWINGSMIMETTRKVRSGEELTYNYGASYWLDPPTVKMVHADKLGYS